MINPNVPASRAASPRFESLDFLRGLAILGILLANIFAFGWISLVESNSYNAFPEGFIPWVEWLRTALVSGKFRGLLAILFGVGMHLQYQKASATGRRWGGAYAWRNVLLVGIGLVHAIGIWHGDILALYGATALVAMWLVGLDDRVILPLAISLLALYFLLGFASWYQPKIGLQPGQEMELALFTSADYGAQVLARLNNFKYYVLFFFVLELELVPLFLIGVFIGRSGIFVRNSVNPSLVRLLSMIGLVGLAINLLMSGTRFNNMIEHGPHVLLSIGYAVWGAMIVQRDAVKFIRRLVVPVGRLALSCYLLQSIVCTALFYGWGLRLFGALDYLSMLAIVPMVWLINIGFANLWLRFFPMGPIEWLWRWAASGENPVKPIRTVA